MAGFFKKMPSVVLATILALGWAWTNYFKEIGWIDDRWRTRILVLVTVLFVIQQLYLAIPKPASLAAVDARRAVVESYLNKCLNEYYRSSQQSGVPSPVVRMNVMLPTRRYIFLQALYIYYVACPPKVVYTDGERDCAWWKNDGTCGYAWTRGRITIFDSSRHDLSAALHRLKPYQRQVAGEVRSVISIPIRDGEKVVGIFNVDSESNVDETKFDRQDVCHLAEGNARYLIAQCFPDGVKRS